MAQVVVHQMTREQGGGWAVEVYEYTGGQYAERSTDSRWTTRARAIREANALADKISITSVAIY